METKRIIGAPGALAQLADAGLIRQRRVSRSSIDGADFDAMNGLVGYPIETCRRGSRAAECATASRDPIAAVGPTPPGGPWP
jgi:ArsR family transcriptional regulator, arsenate/arsenite/antimonite-responsive transcriptional repressor